MHFSEGNWLSFLRLCPFICGSVSLPCPDILNTLFYCWLQWSYPNICMRFVFPKATKEDKEAEWGKSQHFFTLAKGVSQCALHLCNLQGPLSSHSRSSHLLEGEMIEGCCPGLLSCQRRSASLHSTNINYGGALKRGGKRMGGVTDSPAVQ